MPPKKDKKDKGKPVAGAAGKAAAAAMMKAAAGGPAAKPKKPPPPPATFTTDDLIRYKEMFKMFDEDNIEKVKIKDIPLMLRKLGFNPKTAEINYLYENFLEDEYVDTVEYHEWLFMIEAKIAMGDDFEAAIFKAFAALGHDDDGEPTGYCNFEVLREELFTWGEPFQEIEFIDFIRMATRDKTLNAEEGTFWYTRFVENMNGKDTRFTVEPINYFKLDQKTLAAMAMQKAAEEKAEQEKKEAERLAKEEAKRQKMIADGLLPPD